MTTRRRFLHSTLLAGGALALPYGAAAAGATTTSSRIRVVSTWDFGVGANQAAWPVLTGGGRALDAVEAGARWAEGTLCNSTVGRCGYPDRDGVLTLDASIMDGDGRCGAVAALEDIGHPISVARAAGILIDWSDFSELSAAVPLLARVYPNGSADVNAFQASTDARSGTLLGHNRAHLAWLDALLARFGLPVALPSGLDPDALLARMRLDKKATAAGLRLVLWEGAGTARVVGGVDEAALRGVLAA